MMEVCNIVDLYRLQDSLKIATETALRLLSEAVPCQAISLFLFDENKGCLDFFCGTNTKKSISIIPFRLDTPLWMMFESKEAGKINISQIKGEYPTTDIFFEDISRVESIAFSPLLDEKSSKIGVIRLLNKIEQNMAVTDFTDYDLSILKYFSDIVGTLITVSMLRTKYEDFLDSVTHELLAPMSGIKNTASLIERIARQPNMQADLKVHEMLSKKIDDIARFSEHSITIIHGLTMYTRSGKMSATDLDLKISNLFKDIIERSITNLTFLLRSRGFNRRNINSIKYGKWPLLKIDRKVFRQVFNNLLSNSIKYAHDDPTSFNINIELDTLRDNKAIIIIQDYGIGLQEGEVSKIFDPLFRGQKARAKVPTGTGIGLTTVKNLLKAHGCKIEVTNLQLPTEFRITIPEEYVIRREDDIFHRR